MYGSIILGLCVREFVTFVRIDNTWSLCSGVCDVCTDRQYLVSALGSL